MHLKDEEESGKRRKSGVRNHILGRAGVSTKARKEERILHFRALCERRG